MGLLQLSWNYQISYRPESKFTYILRLYLKGTAFSHALEFLYSSGTAFSRAKSCMEGHGFTGYAKLGTWAED